MLKQITETLRGAFEINGIDPALAIVTASEKPDLADYQCNGIRAAAGRLRQNPVELAQKVVASIDDPTAAYSVSGPGFINILLTAPTLEALVSQAYQPEMNTGRVVIDFGGPNVAKPMHVGHLRSLVIGDSLQRILRYAGYDVISDIHLGDWGLQMGLLLAVLKDEPFEDITIERLEAEYPAASQRMKIEPITGAESPEELEDKRANNERAEAFRSEAQRLTHALQTGDADLRRVWKHFIAVSLQEIARELDTLNIAFDLYHGESDVQFYIPEMIDSFMDAGLAKEDKGALVVDVGDPPLILRKSDGAALYATTDLATILDRATLDPAQIIYVTDERQTLHFQQVFKAARMANLYDGTLTHVRFGTIQGADGKPLKTRAGGVPKLHDLIEDAIAKAAEINPESANEVAIAALKFADLQNVPASSYQFDLNRFLAFEGKTGPYLLYQAVRIKSILRKAWPPEPFVVATEDERRLATKVAVGFPAALERAISRLSPKEMADYAYDLAQTFSKFYAGHPIADNGSRVTLAMAVLERLETSLNLLGIKVPEKM